MDDVSFVRDLGWADLAGTSVLCIRDRLAPRIKASAPSRSPLHRSAVRSGALSAARRVS